MCKIGGINCVPYLKSRSLLATYINDDLHIEIMITLPPDWPLSSVNIEGNDVGYTHLRTTTFGPCPPSDQLPTFGPKTDRLGTMSTFGPCSPSDQDMVRRGWSEGVCIKCPPSDQKIFTFGSCTPSDRSIHLRTKCSPSDHLRSMFTLGPTNYCTI